jgi:hypothetical protein
LRAKLLIRWTHVLFDLLEKSLMDWDLPLTILAVLPIILTIALAWADS